MKKISLIIPIYNRISITKEGLKELYKKISNFDESLHQVSYSVIVVDDGSTDGSSDLIRKDFPQVHLLQGDGNLWWSGAINLGSKYAIENLKTDYILLWNDDTYMDELYFTNLAAIIANGNSNNIYGSIIYEYPNKDKIWASGGYFNMFLGIRKMHRNVAYRNNNQWFTGMGTVIPANVVIELNYWDAINFPQYHGDSDFTLRAFKNGIKLITRPELKLWNKVEYSSFIAKNSWRDYIKSLKMMQSRYNIKKEVLFLRKHCITPLWTIYFSYRQIRYLIRFISNKHFNTNN